MTKHEMRQEALIRRSTGDRGCKAALDAAVRHRIISSLLYQNATLVAMYIPIRDEVDLLPLWSGMGKTFVFPRVEGDHLVFCPAGTPDELAPGAFGIREPQNSPISTDYIDLILVPGLMFDRRGYRLGYGKGFYDRLIAAYPAAQTMGVCLEEFLVDSLPTETWDARVKWVVTQTNILITEGEVS